MTGSTQVSARPRWLWPAAWLAGLGALWLALALDGGAASGAVATSSLVRWGLPLATGLASASGAAAIGALALAICVLPRDAAGHHHPSHTPPARQPWLATLRLAANSAGLWVLALIAVLVLTYAKTSGEGLTSAGFANGLIYYATSVTSGRALALSVLLAMATFLATVFMRSYLAVAWTEALAIATLLPQAATSHAAGSGGHMVAMGAGFLHAVSASMWLGALFALTALWRRIGAEPAVARDAVARLGRLGRWCLVLLAVSGAAAASVRLGTFANLFATRYGLVVLLKTGGLLALGVVGWLVERRTVGSWLGVQVALAAAAFGLAAGLAAGKPPVGDGLATTLIEQLTGYPLPPAPSWANFVVLWHLDVLLGTACVAGAVVYIRWVLRLRRRGDSWAWGRTVSWLGGIVTMFWVCDGGPVVYGHLLFSAHMILHMVVAMVIPILLCLGAPVTLLVRAVEPRTDGSRGPREWMLALVHSRIARFFSHPIPASINFVGSMIVFYFTPLFALAMSTHVGHIAMVLHFTLAGYLFANLLIGIDPGPNRPAYPVRLLLLFCTMAFHAFFGIAVISSASVLAGDWFDRLGNVYGIDRLADQATGGAITWGIGEIPTLVLAVALAVAWARADERLAKRQDRAAQRDGDAELEQYNTMLAGLAERDEREAAAGGQAVGEVRQSGAGDPAGADSR